MFIIDSQFKRGDTFKIDGMSCEHCQARVRAALLEQAGVSAANVSLANGTATVLYDAQVTSPYALLQAIGDVGFDADLALEE